MNGLLEEIIATLIVFLLGSILGYIYRAKIGDWLRNCYAWIVNSEVQVHLTRIDKFDQPPTQNLDIEVFTQIQEEYPDVENAGMSEGTLRIKANNIPSVLEIRLEDEHNFDDVQDDIVGHKVVVETYSDLRFGYRSYGSLKRFEEMSEEIVDIVQTQCFTGQHSTQSFVLSQLKEGIPSGIDTIQDEELGITGQVQDSTMQMTIRSPQNLTQGIRRYYRPH